MSRYLPSTYADEGLARAVEADLCEWLEQMPRDMRLRKSKQHPPAVRHPDPHEENGLPEGWVIHSRSADFRLVTDRLLIRRPQGDWVVLDHHRNACSSTPVMAFATLKEVFDNNRNRSNPDAQSARFTGWLQQVFVRCYDMDDLTDAAEMTLVGLGTEITAVPTALT